MWKIYYQVSVNKLLLGVVQTGPVKAFGYPDDPSVDGGIPASAPELTVSTIKSLNKAVNIGIGWCRTFQGLGIDCRYEVHGRVMDLFGAPVVGMEVDPIPVPENPLEPASGIVFSVNGDLYARGDTPDPGVNARIGRANTPIGGVQATIVLDLPEDVLTP